MAIQSIKCAMSYDLESRKQLEASLSQYPIDCNAPVRLSLLGPHSYCNLQDIQDPKLKEILLRVGVEFERNQKNTFFNFTHTFTPIAKNEGNGIHDKHVADIFGFVNTAVNAQTKGTLTLDLADMTRLIVQKGEDRTYAPPHFAYNVSIKISEKAVETAKKSGLAFMEYGGSFPEGEKLYALGVGQKALFIP